MKDTPKIRFRGFTDAWELRKLGEHCDMYNGDRSSKYPNADDMVSDGIPFINAGDLENGTVNLMTCNRISKEKYNDLGGAKLQRGDIVYCLRGTLGKNAFIDNFDEGTVASSLVALRSKNIDGKYLYFILNSDIEYRQRIVRDEGAAQPNLSAKSVSEYIIPVPSEAEQQQVSSYFSKLDILITLHQRKCNDTKELKKYMLQKMFPQNGRKIPEIRFAEFTGDWEQRKLGDVFEEYSEKDHTELPALTIIQGSGTVKREESDRNLIYNKSNLSGYKMVRENDFIVHLRSFEGGLEKASSDGIISPAYHTFHGKNVDSRFYYPYFRSQEFIKKKLIAHVYGIRDGRSIDIDGMKTIEIPYTSYEEQCRIGDYLETLDHLITLHQRKCDELKKVKKFMLQNMFPQKG